MNRIFIFISAMLIFSNCSNKIADQNWPVYHGDNEASHFSPLTQITKSNVSNLKLVWEYHTGDQDERSQIQCSPIIVDGVLYGTSPQIKLFALEAATGKEKWVFDPFEGRQSQGVNRGVVYWSDGELERILYCAGSYLYAIDADSGEPINDFGNHGRVDLHDGLDREGIENYDIVSNTPGIIYNDLLILGTRVSEGEISAPGHIRAYDVKTGAIEWIFHTIPYPGEFGYDTWPEDAWKTVGGANTWAGFSLDEELGIVFAPTGSPSFDFHGGNRHGKNLFGNSLIALNAATGERIWHFQTVHHDLWDKDLPCQPNLITVTHDGKKIDAVAQLTKHGVVFLFDRETGKPLFPIEERPVPASDLINEKAWPTQPFPIKPPPFVRQAFTEEIITDITPESNAYIKEQIKGARIGNKFMPPSKEGTIIYPGFDGGAEYGGGAVSKDGILFVNANEMAWMHKMVLLKSSDEKGKVNLGRMVYMTNCALCHKEDRTGGLENSPSLIHIKNKLSRDGIKAFVKTGKGRMPGFKHLPEEDLDRLVDFLFDETTVNWEVLDTLSVPEERDVPYTFNGYNRLFDQQGYPGVKQPWGTLNAIDLNEGEILWSVPLGEYPELTKGGIPATGTENYGGPLLTASGIIFIAASRDEKIRAFDSENGKILWEAPLPAGGYASPVTYAIDGTQYVVIACGGGKMGTKSGDSYVAFSLE